MRAIFEDEVEHFTFAVDLDDGEVLYREIGMENVLF